MGTNFDNQLKIAQRTPNTAESATNFWTTMEATQHATFKPVIGLSIPIDAVIFYSKAAD